jgi:hypothetical protein
MGELGFFCGRWLMLQACLLAMTLSVTQSGETPVVLENAALRVEFSPQDGAITALRNKQAGLDLVSQVPKTRTPWALLLDPFVIVSKFDSCRVTPDGENPHRSVEFEWQTPFQITIKARAELPAGADEVTFTCAAENNGQRTILAFRYPAIQGIGPLAGRPNDRLLHSTAMGAVFRDPFDLFEENARVPQARGLVVSRYPNGFHGSALQMMAYYAEGRGGFYIAAQDGHGGDKDLNFFKAPGSGLNCEIAHIQWDARPGKSLSVDYPVVVAALREGTWYEAAERYRKWAVQQAWCQQGTRRERVQRGAACRWLLENVGAVGAWWPFREDIHEDVSRTRKMYGAPLLHLELWWRNQAARAAAQSDGDRFGPFYFPFLALKDKPPFAAHAQDQIFPPATPISPDWIAMCPAQPGWREIALRSAEDMAGSGPQRDHQIWVDENHTGCNADCLYFDIGPCAGVPTHCYAAGHVHAPGAGREMIAAYRSLLEEMQKRASAARGAYVPMGTECVSEPFVGCLDLYYARNSGFNPDMEVGPYVRDLTWLPDGRMEIVPLFPFVYHEYGPVAMQGVYPVCPWGLSASDDFFTWAEARSVLWGGLIVSFPVTANAAPTPERARYLRALTAARTGYANEFLAYGRMQRPPEVQCGKLSIDHGLGQGGWMRKIRFPEGGPKWKDVLPETQASGDAATRPSATTVEKWVKEMLAVPATPARSRTLEVPVVMAQAFTLGDDRLGILLVNLRRSGEETAKLTIDPARYGLRSGAYALARVAADGSEDLGRFEDRRAVELHLPPASVVLLKVTHQE